MDKLGDMDLFVRVVRNSGLAAAGREVGLSPASMSARISGLEARYDTRLLVRTTRRVSLTDAGQEFYASCTRILAEVAQAEARLQSSRTELSGPLRVTASSDLGQQHVGAVLSRFVDAHPGVEPYLYLSDGVVNLVEEGFDLAVRYGSLPDSNLVARRLAANRRVLCASPDYLERRGTPNTPAELTEHDCLVMIRANEVLATWHFRSSNQRESVVIHPARATNDGAALRRWALDGAGIALKSMWDVKADLDAGRLVTVLDDYVQDFSRRDSAGTADLYVVYPDRRYLPARTRGFIDALAEYFAGFSAGALK